MERKWNNNWIIYGFIAFAAFRVSESHTRYQENYIEEDKFLPNFVTIGQKYSIAIGSTVVLPCKINETEHSSQYVLAWKRDIAVLTAGQVKVTVNPRLRLMPPQEMQNNEPRTSSYNLEIRDVRLTDAGEYACQIGSMEPKEIVHTLEVLVPPKINTVTPSTRVEVQKGNAIRLECRANGNPPPKIIWSRKNNVMPNGEANITSNELEVMYADRHTVGHYRCTADNRVGQPDTKDIFVNVLYPPEIEVEQPFVHTGVGFEAKLTCIVHAEPLPHVIWYKDTTQLGTTEQHSQQNRGNRYSLIIRNVTNNDLGNYTCQATNSISKDRASLTLSAIPTVCVFDSPPLSNFRDQYNISWALQSYSPIREYRLFYRKEVSPRSHSHHEKLDNHIGAHYYTGMSYMGSSSHGGVTGVGTSGGYLPLGNPNNGIIGPGSGIHSEHEKWKNIVISGVHPTFNEHDLGMGYTHPYGYTNNGVMMTSNGVGYRDQTGINRNHNIRHKMSYLIRNLTPATNYEARVQARNDHDWNKLSGVFYFSTRAEDLELEPSAQPAVSKTAGVLDKDAFSGAAGGALTKSSTNLLQLSSSSYLNRILSVLIVLSTFLSL